MAECEAGIDSSMDAYIQYPNEERTVENIPLMDINGTDYTLEEVKNQLLRSHGIAPQAYHLAFRNEINGTIIYLSQETLITDCIPYLSSSHYTIVFVDPSRSASK